MAADDACSCGVEVASERIEWPDGACFLISWALVEVTVVVAVESDLDACVGSEELT